MLTEEELICEMEKEYYKNLSYEAILFDTTIKDIEENKVYDIGLDEIELMFEDILH